MCTHIFSALTLTLYSKESTEFLEALVTGEEFQNAIGENAEGALEKIANAEDEYEPDTIIARV